MTDGALQSFRPEDIFTVLNTDLMSHDVGRLSDRFNSNEEQSMNHALMQLGHREVRLETRMFL
jgi:hypothetical protein